MREVGREIAEQRLGGVSVVKGSLKRGRNMGRIGAPGEIVRNNNKAAVTAPL